LTGVRRATPAEHTAESVAAAEFGSDDIALCAERFAQCGDLYLKVLFRHHDARPYTAEELFLCDEQAIGLQQDQKEIEGARAEYDRNTVREQLPPAQQHAETPEFESRVGCCRTRPVWVVLQRIKIYLHCTPSAWIFGGLQLGAGSALVAPLNKGSLSGKDNVATLRGSTR
jgi:hypothetical protein